MNRKILLGLSLLGLLMQSSSMLSRTYGGVNTKLKQSYVGLGEEINNLYELCNDLESKLEENIPNSLMSPQGIITTIINIDPLAAETNDQEVYDILFKLHEVLLVVNSYRLYGNNVKSSDFAKKVKNMSVTITGLADTLALRNSKLYANRDTVSASAKTLNSAKNRSFEDQVNNLLSFVANVLSLGW